MITSIEIQGLRGIREGRIEGLAPLTILVGPNGCGKSTMLEALGVACAGGSAAAAFRAMANREWLGLSGLSYWMSTQGGRVSWAQDVAPSEVFSSGPFNSIVRVSTPAKTARYSTVANGKYVPTSPDAQFATLSIETSWTTKSEPQRALGWADIDDDGEVHNNRGWVDSFSRFELQSSFVDRAVGAAHRLSEPHFSSAMRDALTAIKLSPWYDELFSYLQILRPTLTSIESIAVGDRDEPHMFERDPKHGRMGYPLAYAGDGFRRSLLLAGTFARAKGGVAALDEPEAFAHPGMFAPLTGLIKRAVGDGTQVVLATHSLEFVAATLQAFEDQADKAAVIGLRMESGVLDPLVISGPDARQRVLEFGHDLRL